VDHTAAAVDHTAAAVAVDADKRMSGA
jgi:hypothetical protein